MKVKERSEVPSQDQWDLTGLYRDDAAWSAELATVQALCAPQLRLKGLLGESASHLSQCLTLQDALHRVIDRLHTYASRRADEDTANTHCMGMIDQIRKAYVRIGATLSWIRPEILEIPEDTLSDYMGDPVMAAHKRTMEVLLRDKPFLLSEKEERLLALAGEPLDASSQTFGLLNNADLRFPTVTDENGDDVEVSQGNYPLFLESTNRDVRRSAFEGMFKTYDSLKNTLSSTLVGNINKNIFYARARGHESALKASLHQDNVDLNVYDSLIDAVHAALPVFHKYTALRKKLLKLDALDMYDLYVHIVPDFSLDVPFETAFNWIKAAVAPLGKEYQETLSKALDERWIDRYENRGKRSGAYSGGCFDSNPFILMNYQNSINSAFTLAHELGHSMHSHFSNRNQPHNMAAYTIFVAEVASTLNEGLLFEYLMTTTDDPRLKAYLLNQKCEGFKGTVFRQTMFAEFEKMIYAKAEQSIPLTPDELSRSYYELNKLYYGADVEANPLISVEWARIPHFYYNFYVYKYATGFSAAEAFLGLIQAGGEAARDNYLGFLKAGGSNDPLDILADAGVDLRKPDVIEAGLQRFSSYIDELEALLT